LIIADFSRVLAGPFATMTLGDLGADVIKVERPEGDDTRAWGPPFAAGESTYYLGLNRNKRSIVLDLRDRADRDIAARLVRHADVLVENFRPGVMARFGLDEPTVRTANPTLVYCSISAFGSAAGRDLPGYDLLLQALGGLMSITGPDATRPTKVGVAMVDVIAGLFATIGILAALHERERSGTGQRVEVNLLSSLLSALANQSASHVLADIVPAAMGNGHPSIAPYDTFQTGDGTLVLAIGTDHQFGLLCDAIAGADLSIDPRFSTNERRVRHRHHLRDAIEYRLAERGAAEWTSILTAVGVPAGSVNNIKEAFALAEQLGLRPIAQSDDEPGVRGRHVASPLTFAETPVAYRRGAPKLGEHDKDIRALLEYLETHAHFNI
jgi:crotonobetainyl-CoA:carnitine CoA-transferase CaiB-like acyl-CoA transferase